MLPDLGKFCPWLGIKIVEWGNSPNAVFIRGNFNKWKIFSFLFKLCNNWFGKLENPIFLKSDKILSEEENCISPI